MSEQKKLENIIPCPFCGEEPITRTIDGEVRVYHVDQGCPMSAGWTTLEIWQKRPLEDKLTEINPRAMKLLRAKKPFLVVSETESYYLVVYNMIRNNEKMAGTWTEEDESRYQTAIEKWDRE